MDLDRTPCLHSPLSPAIQRCCDARNAVLTSRFNSAPPEAFDPTHPQFSLRHTTSKFDHKTIAYADQQLAEAAYRYAMPDPSTRQGVRDYIACVLHGMTIGVFGEKAGHNLLSGARVALSAQRGKSAKSAQKANTQISTENQQQQVP